MSDQGDRLVQMEVKGLMMDPNSSVPIVILRGAEEAKLLPIWIGIFEANAIALKLEGIEPPRPMTHDLMFALLAELEAEVERVIICSLRENTFFAQVILQTAAGVEHSIDARPSDAIALALRSRAPIYVSEEVLDKASAEERTQQLHDEEKLKKWLEEVDPDDLGKYTM